ncbi:MAG: ABC transporter ATP-binding protein, partial [Planctomycetaceae bacterium]
SIDLILLALVAFSIWVLGRGAVSTSILESKKKYAMAAWLQDLASCDHAFRYAAAADFALDRADQLTYDYLDARRQHFRVLIRQVVFTLFLQAIARAGGGRVGQGQVTLGQLVAAELIVAVIVGAFAKLGKHIESFYDLLASVDKLGGLFDLPMDRQEGLLSLPNDGPAAVDVDRLTYHNEHGGGLASLSFRVAPGDRVAITGESGVGKSTLLNLISGRIEPSSGRVAIDGIDPYDVRPTVLQQHIVTVERPEVFTGTIAENVHLGRPDVSVQDVRRALNQVGLFDTAVLLEDGLETPLTRSGAPLTESQLRRLTLARALVAEPRLLIVDGLLDAFPDDEAVALASELCARGQPWTLILVTGREALAELCDNTITLAGGAHHKTEN